MEEILFTLLTAWQKWFKGETVCLGSWFESVVHHDEEDMMEMHGVGS